MTPRNAFAACLAAAALAAIAPVAWPALAQSGAVNARPAPAPAPGAPPSFADIVARVAPAVVSIDIAGKVAPQAAALPQPPPGVDPFGEDPFGEEPFGGLRRFFGVRPGAATPLRATGSGFFVAPDGYIVTNNHVVEGAGTITVRTQDGRRLKARLVGRDPATDLAVVKVDGSGFSFVSFEDRSKPRVGDWVVAVGNPFNLGGTATAGIVSALGRPNVSGSSYVDYLQIDAPINRGNSGGPSFDVQGRVVGVNSAIFSPSGGSVGIGFAIPADVAARVTRELIRTGKVTRGYLGAQVQEVTPDIAASLGMPTADGALVATVTPDGPAARAGVQPGDVILRLDGCAVTSGAELTRQVAAVAPGALLHLQVRRGGRMLALTATARTRPAEQVLAGGAPAEAGAPAAGAGLGLAVTPRDAGGVTVQAVAPGSEAAAKGLRAGDVILQAGGRAVRSADDVRAAVAAARQARREALLVLIARGGRQLFIPLSLAPARG